MPSNFSLETFTHPLTQVPCFASEYRGEIFVIASDYFHAGLEEYFLGQDFWALKDWKRNSYEANKSWYNFDISMNLGLIPAEAEILFRRRGDSAEAAHVRSLVQKAMQNDGPVLSGNYPSSMYYLFTGAFVEGIDAAKEELNRLEAYSEQVVESKKTLIGIISRFYEALGEFEVAADWKTRQMLMLDSPYAPEERGLVRLYLKLGQFGQAAEVLLSWYEKAGKKGGYDHFTVWRGGPAEGLRVANLYALGGNKEACMEIVSKFMTDDRWFLESLEKSGIADTLKYKGFFEEAAKIYDHLALMEKGHVAVKAEVNAHAPGEPQVSEAATEEVLLCVCGETLQPHWKLCPSCGKSVEMVCSCGESLKAGWKLCPACGKRISE